MKKGLKRVIALAVACGMLLTTGITAFADTKEDAQYRIKQLQQEQAALQQRLSQLQAEKEDTEAYIEALDAEMTQVITDIKDVNDRLAIIEDDIRVTEENLQKAEEKAERQYQALKLRIKQMYEQGDPSLMDILMKAEDIATILNSSEYISKISDYDNALLTALYATLQEIETYKTQLEAQKVQEEAVKAELEIKQQGLQSVIDQKNAELVALGVDINDAYNYYVSNNSAIDDLASIVAAIEAEEQRQAALWAAQQAAQSGGQSYTDNSGAQGSYDTGAGQTVNTDTGYTGSTSGGSATGSFINPLSGGYLSSSYGYRDAPTAGASSQHAGVDIAAPAGSDIYAADGGTVTTVGYTPTRGNYVVVTHANGVSTLYQHCSAIYATQGQSVSQGTTIAAVGSTGVSTGAHLHYEVLVNGQNVDPSGYLQ